MQKIWKALNQASKQGNKQPKQKKTANNNKQERHERFQNN